MSLAPSPFARFARCLCDGARLMVGQPSYEAYIEHLAANHPDRPPMSRTEFFRNRQEARYGGGAGFRCC